MAVTSYNQAPIARKIPSGAKELASATGIAATVTLGQDGPHLTFTVADDGQGFDPATTPIGSGLQGIADRLAALGGTIDVASALGRGAQITGRIPASRRSNTDHNSGAPVPNDAEPRRSDPAQDLSPAGHRPRPATKYQT